MYAYGVSLGAQILGLYLEKDPNESEKFIDASCMFATPWSILKGYKFFYENVFGWWQNVIGMSLNRLI